MFVRLRDVTHKSVFVLSIVTDALPSKPRHSPTWMNTSETANATPDTVMADRSLSCSRIFRA